MSNDTSQPVVFLVRFKSSLSYDEVLKRAKDRLPQFQALPGLLQKYYVHDPVTNEFGGFYVWDSQESLDAYMESDLRKTIADAYEVVGAPRVEKLNVATLLRE